MKKMIFKTKYIYLLALGLILAACSDDDTNSNPAVPPITAGSADFSTFVSVGNSLTAGFTDNALFIASQQNSLPNILANQFALVGGGNFTQPLMNDNIGGLLFGGVPNPSFGPRLFFNGSGPAPLPGATPTTEVFAPSNGPYNNMGIPGAKSYHLLFDGYGNPANLGVSANPYFVRMASAPNATVVGDAMSMNPTFFSLWPGENDVLGYALSGGDGSNPITPLAGPPGVGFEETYGVLVATMTSTGAKGVVSNIPYVTSIPHFTTVPYNPLDPSTDFGDQIPTLNLIYGALNQIFIAYGETDRVIVFTEDDPWSEDDFSALVIIDETLTDFSGIITGILANSPEFVALIGQFGLPPQAAPQVASLLGFIYGQARQATEDDLFVLPSSNVIGTANTDNVAFLMSQGLSQELAIQFSIEGITLPLEDKWVLIPSEQMEIKNATDEFNAVIETTAMQAGLALVDSNMLMEQLANDGFPSGGFVLTSDLVLGGAFSLDGVHPTARGYALIANEFLKAIDATYGSNFEASRNLVNIGDYPTNYPPTLQ